MTFPPDGNSSKMERRCAERRLQGVLAPHLRPEEEAAIVHHLAGSIPFTVAMDGLDEATDTAESVRKAITYWLKSPLGQMSVDFSQ